MKVQMKNRILVLIASQILAGCSVSVDDENKSALQPGTPENAAPDEKRHEITAEVIIEDRVRANEDLIYRISKAKRLVFRKNAVLELRDQKLEARLDSVLSENGRIVSFEKSDTAKPGVPALSSGKIVLRMDELKGKLQLEVRGQTGAMGIHGLQGLEGQRGVDYVQPPSLISVPTINIGESTLAKISYHFDKLGPCEEYPKIFAKHSGQQGYPGQNGYPGESGGDTEDLSVEVLTGVNFLTVIYEAGLGGPGGQGGPGGLGGVYGNFPARSLLATHCSFSNLRGLQGPKGSVGPRGYEGKKGQFLLNGK